MFLYYSSSFARPLSLIVSRLFSILYLPPILNMAEVRRNKAAFQHEDSGLFNYCSISVANTASFSAAALESVLFLTPLTLWPSPIGSCEEVLYKLRKGFKPMKGRPRQHWKFKERLACSKCFHTNEKKILETELQECIEKSFGPF